MSAGRISSADPLGRAVSSQPKATPSLRSGLPFLVAGCRSSGLGGFSRLRGEIVQGHRSGACAGRFKWGDRPRQVGAIFNRPVPTILIVGAAWPLGFEGINDRRCRLLYCFRAKACHHKICHGHVEIFIGRGRHMDKRACAMAKK